MLPIISSTACQRRKPRKPDADTPHLRYAIFLTAGTA
jgi:hypothetical protein